MNSILEADRALFALFKQGKKQVFFLQNSWVFLELGMTSLNKEALYKRLRDLFAKKTSLQIGIQGTTEADSSGGFLFIVLALALFFTNSSTNKIVP